MCLRCNQAAVTTEATFGSANGLVVPWEQLNAVLCGCSKPFYHSCHCHATQSVIPFVVGSWHDTALRVLIGACHRYVDLDKATTAI